MPFLTTLAAYKAFRGVTDASLDNAVNAMIPYGNDYNKQYLGGDQDLQWGTNWPITQSFTDYLSGQGSRWLVLPRRPVQSITSIYLDNGAYFGEASGAFGPLTLLTQGTDYRSEEHTS